MKLFLLTSIALLTITGCSSQPELSCGGDNVKDLAGQVFKNALLGNNVKAPNAPEPNWEYIFPSYKIEFKDIRLTSKNKEMNQITCEANVESNIFDIRKLTVDMINELEIVKDYFEKKEPVNHKAYEEAYMLSNNLKVIAMNLTDNGTTYPLKYEVQPTEDKKSIYLKFTSDIPGNMVEIINALSQTSYNIHLAKTKMKENPLSQDIKSNSAVAIQAADPALPSNAAQMNVSQSIPPTPSAHSASSAPSDMLASSAPNAQISTSALDNTKVTAASWAPSFDCAKASTGPERLICDNKSLSELDVKLSVVYRQNLEIVNDKEALRVSQRNWRKFKRDACSDISCISNSYSERIAEVTTAK